MRISAKSEYAILALLELASKYDNKSLIRLEEIAQSQKIPQKYLVQIFLQLKQLGLVKSKRGAQGGYFLGDLPENITLGQIIQAIEGPLLNMQCLTDNPADECARKGQCGFASIWAGIRVQVNEIFDGITLDDINKQIAENKSDGNNYII